MPTRRGIAVLAAGVLLTALGYGYGYPELVALGAVAIAAFVGAALFAGARPALQVARSVAPERVTRGEQCLAVVNVRSTARLRSQVLVGAERITRGAAPDPEAAPDHDAAPAPAGWVSSLLARAGWLRGAAEHTQEVPMPLIRLRAGERTFLRYPLPTARRGVIEVGPMEIARRDPLGLIAATRRYGDLRRVWVHPRSHPVRTVPVGVSRSLDGVVDAAQYGSITFHALREYVPGDDLRHVHWRTSAHIGELMVRQHVETSLPRLVVLLDDRAAAHSDPPGRTEASAELPDGFDSLEETAEAAASVLLAALRAELHVELHLVSGRAVTPQAAGAPVLGVGPYLDLLAEVRRERRASLPAAVQRLRARHRGDTLILLTGSHDGADLEQVGLLRDVYPSVVAGVLGEGALRLAGLHGLIVVSARTAAEFAPRWDGVSRW